MGSEGSTSKSSSRVDAANIIEYIYDIKLFNAVKDKPIKQWKFNGDVENIVEGKNYVYSALWLSNKDFENTNEKGLIIEYGNSKKEF